MRLMSDVANLGDPLRDSAADERRYDHHLGKCCECLGKLPHESLGTPRNDPWKRIAKLPQICCRKLLKFLRATPETRRRAPGDTLQGPQETCCGSSRERVPRTPIKTLRGFLNHAAGTVKCIVSTPRNLCLLSQWDREEKKFLEPSRNALRRPPEP